jgi:type IV secretory pathway VirJ component
MKYFHWLVALSCLMPVAAAAQATTSMPSFGDVTVYKPAGSVFSVTVFLSGDGGWNQGVIPMAQKLVEQNALVIGVNTPKFLADLDKGDGACTNPSDALLALIKNIKMTNNVSQNIAPVLVGYSSGATIAYAALVQAGAGKFQGGIGLGFCPDLETVKPMCEGAGLTHIKNTKGPGFVYGAATHISTPFVALQGGQDKVCDPAATDAFIDRVKGASVIDLPKVGHGFSVPKNWMPQYVQAYRKIAGGAGQ